MLEISLSVSGGDEATITDKTSSGKPHEGARLPIQNYDGDLKKETREEYKHKAKKRKGKLKSKKGMAIPYPGTLDEHSGSPRAVTVKKNIWLGRHERDGAPKRRRMIPGNPDRR